MTKLLLIVNLLLITPIVLSQNSNENKINDSLYTVLQNADEKEKIQILIKMANNSLYISPESTEHYAREALDLAKEYKDTLSTIISYNIIGGVHQYKSQYDSAIFYFTKGIEEAKLINNRKQQIASIANIGNIYSEQQEYEKAISIYKSSLDIIGETDDKVTKARLLNNLGMAYSFIGEYKASLKYLNKALAIKNTTNDQISYGITLSNMGKVFEAADSVQKAENYYFKALNIFNDNNSTYNSAFINNRLANLFFSSNKFEKSYSFALRSIEQAKEARAAKIVRSGYDLLIRHSKMKNDYPRVIKYYEEYIRLSEDLFEKQNQQLISEMEVKYETEIKEHELEAKDIKLKQKNLLLYIIITIFLIGIVFTLIIILQKKKLKTANEYLVKTNLDIVASNKKFQELKERSFQQSIGSINKEILENEKDESLIKRIEKAIEIDKLYLDTNLTIFDFAEILNTNKTYISNLINKEFDKNFNMYINEFRITEAIALMTSPSNDNYTINAIAENSGFNSISTFNRSFKKYTGVTPSYFWKTIKDKR